MSKLGIQKSRDKVRDCRRVMEDVSETMRQIVSVRLNDPDNPRAQGQFEWYVAMDCKNLLLTLELALTKLEEQWDTSSP